jgi:hypothetical protein
VRTALGLPAFHVDDGRGGIAGHRFETLPVRVPQVLRPHRNRRSGIYLIARLLWRNEMPTPSTWRRRHIRNLSHQHWRYRADKFLIGFVTVHKQSNRYRQPP